MTAANDRSQFALIRETRFGPLFVTQFLGSFNDNLFKNALLVFITFQLAAGDADNGLLVNVAAGLFILPFFLFSATAGQLADKIDKAKLIRLTKLAEVLIMLAAAVALHARHVPSLLAILFLMGAQSAFFGPAKYSILPQHLRETELVGGNALIEAGTFIAILLGTLLGGVLVGQWADGLHGVAAGVMAVAVAGYLSSRRIPPAAPPTPALRIDFNPLREMWRNFQFTRGNRTVFLSILGVSWFWLLGAVYLTQLPQYTKSILGGNEQVVTLMLILFSLGIGSGSLLCERLSGHKVEIGLVPFGSIGLTLFGLDLYFAAPAAAGVQGLGAGAFVAAAGSGRVLLDVFCIGLFGGFYTVPLYALVQLRSAPDHRSRIIAGNNILNALFMVLAALLAIVLLGAGFTIPQLFLTLALLNAVVAIYIYTLVPEFLMRFLVWLLIHTIYHVDKRGLEQIPDEGPALLICNHVSFVDALVIGGCVRRPIRFVMYYKIFAIPVLNFIFRTARAIPIAGARENPELMERAFTEVSTALRQGDLVCIFPEGRLTDTGEMNEFRPGILRILERDPVPVIPLALRGLWGSLFSRGRRFRFPSSRIGLVAGAPQSAGAVSLPALQQQVQALRGDWR